MLPGALDEVVAGFLSGGRYYLPSGILPQLVSESVATAYRYPVSGCWLGSSLAAGQLRSL